ncbi:MAG TPA: hypothetical protein VMT16_04065 [Thermoanaerobaculia bacterium]|nr:hypothetical protein [Thermoanaerobaculia bacterium]
MDERRLFKVIHSDLGRPLTDISQRFDHRSIESDLREETTDGVAITFVDIGELVRLREEVEALRRQLAAAPEAGRGGAISRRDRPSGPER